MARQGAYSTLVLAQSAGSHPALSLSRGG
jgi:hypothetical protein